MDNRVGVIRGSVQVTETHIRWKNVENIKIPGAKQNFPENVCIQLMDQAVKYIEDMQDDFDFRYKTLQSRGEQSEISEQNTQEYHTYVVSCVFLRLHRSEL